MNDMIYTPDFENTATPQMTFPHTYDNGLTVIRLSPRGAALITDGIMVTWIQGGWLRADGSLTPRGMQTLMEATETLAEYEQKNREYKERKEAERKAREEAWKVKKEEGAKMMTFVLNPGILMSGSTSAYKYACGRKRGLYGGIVTNWIYIPKSQLKVERKNSKVYVTLPKWLAEKHGSIFSETVLVA